MGTFGWGVAVVMVIVVSWMFYKYLAPKGWREWAGAGLVQAFIIALYAEMYGFPLTVYLAIRFFGLDREYVSFSLWSTLLNFSETGMFVAMILGYIVAFFGIGLFIKKIGWLRPACTSLSDTRNIPAFSLPCSVKGSFIGLPYSRSAFFR